MFVGIIFAATLVCAIGLAIYMKYHPKVKSQKTEHELSAVRPMKIVIEEMDQENPTNR